MDICENHSCSCQSDPRSREMRFSKCDQAIVGEGSSLMLKLQKDVSNDKVSLIIYIKFNNQEVFRRDILLALFLPFSFRYLTFLH